MAFATMVDGAIVRTDVDAKSLTTMAEVTRLLLNDRAREAKKAADALTRRMHAIVEREYRKPHLAEREDDEVEDRIRECFEKELGVALDERQTKRLAANRAHIVESGGPSDAAAAALRDAIQGAVRPSNAGRSIYAAKNRAKSRPPVVGPLNRYVPLRDVRRYMNAIFDNFEAEAARRAAGTLHLGAVDDPNAFANELIERVARRFEADAGIQLEAVRDELIAVIHTLLLGDRPPVLLALPASDWATLSEAAAAARQRCAAEPRLAEVMAKDVANAFLLSLKAVFALKVDADTNR